MASKRNILIVVQKLLKKGVHIAHVVLAMLMPPAESLQCKGEDAVVRGTARMDVCPGVTTKTPGKGKFGWPEPVVPLQCSHSKRITPVLPQHLHP